MTKEYDPNDNIEISPNDLEILDNNGGNRDDSSEPQSNLGPDDGDMLG